LVTAATHSSGPNQNGLQMTLYLSLARLFDRAS